MRQAGAALVAIAMVATIRAQEPTLEVVLARAAAYVADYQ